MGHTFGVTLSIAALIICPGLISDKTERCQADTDTAKTLGGSHGLYPLAGMGGI